VVGCGLHLGHDAGQRQAAALPRRAVTMQKVQRLSQPSWTLTRDASAL
jgi:hypothetical protein